VIWLLEYDDTVMDEGAFGLPLLDECVVAETYEDKGPSPALL